MGLFNSAPYPGMGSYGSPMSGVGLRGLFLVLGFAFGLYFLNLTFLWVKIPALSVAMIKPFNVAVGALFIILGIMAIIRRRY